MGGSSPAPEVITATANLPPSTILDSTAPGQVLAAIDGDAGDVGGLAETALLDRPPKSGSTIETDFPGAPRLRGGLDRPRHRPRRAHRGRHRSGLAARRLGARGGLPRVQRRPERGAATSALTARSASCPRASPASTCRRSSTRPTRPCSRCRSTTRATPLISPPPGTAAGAPRRDKLGLITDGHAHRGPARLDRAARRRVDGQRRHRHPARSCSPSPEADPEFTPADVQLVRRRRRRALPPDRTAPGRDPRQRAAARMLPMASSWFMPCCSSWRAM